MRRTRRQGLPSRFSALPAELITEILEYLPWDKLWTASRVSRQFYAAAWRAGLVIYWGIIWTETYRFGPALAEFKEIVEHAKRKDLRLDLTVWCYFPGEHSPDAPADFYDEFQSSADELFPVLSDALPVLVSLSLQIPDHFRTQLDAALRFPAPKLRTLELHRTRNTIPCSIPIPGDLFGGSAPQLHTLRLGTVTLPELPVPALRSVSHAMLRYVNRFPPINIGRHLPHLTSLRVDFMAMLGVDPELPDQLDLSGLSLRGIVIEDANNGNNLRSLLGVVERSVDLSLIPAIGVVGGVMDLDDKIFRDDPTELFMRATFDAEENEVLRMHVLPAHRRWRRLYNTSYWDADVALPVHELPNLSARLTYLRVDAQLVRGFLALEQPFPALRDLHIDVHAEPDEHVLLAPPDYTGESELQLARVWAPCAALEEITLFASDDPVTAADSHRVAFLAQALGQMQRPKADRASLALVGVEFAKPIASALLGPTVSKIRRYAFAGAGSPEDYDEGLWDCDIFDRDSE